MRLERTLVVAALGTTQTVAWASSYYLAAIVADPIAVELGIPRSVFFGMFSGALLLTAFLGPAVGQAIDRRGGRGILAISNLVFAAGLALLAVSHGAIGLSIAWAALGVAMALGLYDTAFATLAGLYGSDARAAITGITLIAGFASTVGWPLTTLLTESFGWREACFAWAAIHLVIGLPLNRLLIPAIATPSHQVLATASDAPPPPRGASVVLAFVFAATWFISTAMAAHLPRLLELSGATAHAAVWAASLVGPAQVAARFVEFSLQRWLHPLNSARVACLLHPAGAALLTVLGAPAAFAFALLHGAGNGMLTIAKGTLPLALFGAAGYGLRTGLLSAPARVAQAGAPLIFGVLLDAMGPAALAVSAGLSLAALASLGLLRARPVGGGSTVAARS